VLNFSNREQQVTIPIPEGTAKSWQMLFAGNDVLNSVFFEGQVHLPAYGVAILTA